MLTNFNEARDYFEGLSIVGDAFINEYCSHDQLAIRVHGYITILDREIIKLFPFLYGYDTEVDKMTCMESRVFHSIIKAQSEDVIAMSYTDWTNTSKSYRVTLLDAWKDRTYLIGCVLHLNESRGVRHG